MEASKQTDMTLKRQAKALVLKFRKQANTTTKEHVRTCPQFNEASKQTDVTSKRHAKAHVRKLRMRANITMKGHVRASLKLRKQANKLM